MNFLAVQIVLYIRAMLNNKIYDLKERTFIFSAELLKLTKRMKYDCLNSIILKQVIRSGTSIGANYEEACEGFSNKDFKYKAAVARKEAKETNYWLRLMLATDLVPTKEVPEINHLITETKEFVKILSAMIK